MSACWVTIFHLMQHIQAGETVLRIPLSIAITDHMGDQESNKLIYKGAPWAVRLACKILREKAKGPNSPWHLYLQVHNPACMDSTPAFAFACFLIFSYVMYGGPLSRYQMTLADVCLDALVHLSVGTLHCVCH